MRYQYCPNNPERYATNLRREQGTHNLKWDSARGQDALIVQTPFKCSAVEQIEELCGLMEKANLQPDQYTEIKPGIWVRFVTAADKAKMSGCPIHTDASTYSVFSCYTEGNVCSIYAPQQNQAMITAYCNIPMQVHIDVREQTRMEGFIRRRAVQTGYYTLAFPQDLAGGYREGDLAYRVCGLDIPITKQMVKQGVVYIKTSNRPEVISKNKGMNLV